MTLEVGFSRSFNFSIKSLLKTKLGTSPPTKTSTKIRSYFLFAFSTKRAASSKKMFTLAFSRSKYLFPSSTIRGSISTPSISTFGWVCRREEAPVPAAKPKINIEEPSSKPLATSTKASQQNSLRPFLSRVRDWANLLAKRRRLPPKYSTIFTSPFIWDCPLKSVFPQIFTQDLGYGDRTVFLLVIF